LELFIVILNYGNIIINNPNRMNFKGIDAVAYYVSLAIVTGIFEESLFRGIITGGLIKAMPKTKKGISRSTNINTKSDMIFVLIEGMLQIVLFIVPNVIIALKTIRNLTPEECNIWR
jgi:hypothetical protein